MKNKNKENILKASKEKGHLTFKGKSIQVTVDFFHQKPRMPGESRTIKDKKLITALEQYNRHE